VKVLRARFLPDQRLLTSAPDPALAALGQRLRQAREAAGLSADALAERLRLGPEQLLALEKGEAWRLPEPVFVLAMARRVASSLQLEAEAELLALRDQLQPGPAQAPGTIGHTGVAAAGDQPGGMVRAAQRAWRRLFAA
jgi:transcriptional regulator with XRE-family HTH domain